MKSGPKRSSKTVKPNKNLAKVVTNDTEKLKERADVKFSPSQRRLSPLVVQS